ncbi:MAG: hypothetical protein WA324_00370, partial [Bryobacteraceae bacterium]
ELAEFGRTYGQQLSDALFRQATFGVYSRRAKEGSWNGQVLIRQRRIDYNLRFLDKLVVAGADPEVPYPAEQVRAAVNTLAELTPGVTARNIRARAVSTISAVRALSADPLLQADCDRAEAGIKAGPRLLDVDGGPLTSTRTTGTESTIPPTRGDIASVTEVEAAKVPDLPK